MNVRSEFEFWHSVCRIRMDVSKRERGAKVCSDEREREREAEGTRRGEGKRRRSKTKAIAFEHRHKHERTDAHVKATNKPKHKQSCLEEEKESPERRPSPSLSRLVFSSQLEESGDI